ncbi:hypothetical protein K402DRAFT_414810 [Aulographum hederae CBS 113979]|uniref:Uncharacterized protein n=1 Tax=Aulographum hederae CBS 113979 TaxID=1176131 RepID=A0A6G1GPQ1_9PEZI|nr:hypothetical protein K402DRAFT_414810 [Aulographum hederae CBS 113979]
MTATTRENADAVADVVDQVESKNPNLGGFSAALSCYPVAVQLASLLDLNSLHNLSLTCRQFRFNLIQFRDQLVQSSLRCSNETRSNCLRLADGLRGLKSAWEGGSGGVGGSMFAVYKNSAAFYGGRITSGRVGKCARDMVTECRKCEGIFCRNCTIKPPPQNQITGRLRRLCRTCAKAPLENLTGPPSEASQPLPYRIHSSSGASSTSSVDSIASSASDSPAPPKSEPQAFTYSAFVRTPCTCDQEVHICQPCGHSLRASDTGYARIWTWRTRYSNLGGLGTGIGEGNEGVECGRGERCLNARRVEKEVELDPEEMEDMRRTLSRESQIESGGSSSSGDTNGRSWEGGSFLAQEVEGLGGVVKMKGRKVQMVGATVREWEEERDGGACLEKERKGEARSWCGWCERVVLSKKDKETNKRA